MRKAPVGIRDVLDEAVRRLAASPAPLADRLVEVGEVLVTSGLDSGDFEATEDAELFERIGLTVMVLSETEVSDATIAATVQDILDLRDAIMGRAILEAKQRKP